MQAISRKFIRVARWVGLVLIAATACAAPAAVAAPPQITVSPEPPDRLAERRRVPDHRDGDERRVRESARIGWSLDGGPAVGVSTLLAGADCPHARDPHTRLPRRPTCRMASGISCSWRSTGPIRCSGTSSTESGTSRRTSRADSIDHSAAAPQGLALVGRRRLARATTASTSHGPRPPDGGTPYAGVDYRICPASNRRVADVTGCITGDAQRSLTRFDRRDIAVPGTGVWRLEVALRDELGHVDLDAGATTEDLRLDVDAPQSRVPSADPADPARVQLSVTDEGSGIASVAIEARRRGDETWRTLSVAANEGRLTALLDDDDLPAGTYEVRGHAIDAVGNERTLTLDDSTLIQLPVRRGSRLVGRHAEADRQAGTDARRRVRRSASALGCRSAVESPMPSGKVARTSPVEVSERVALPGVAWRSAHDADDRQERLVHLHSAQGSGSHDSLPVRRHADHASGWLRGDVARACGLDAAPESANASATATPWCSAVVSSAGRFPSSGKLVTVQAWTSRGWLTFGNARARSKDGKWSYRYTFTGTSTTSRYRFRAVVTQEEAYPYVTGSSPVRAVVVRGCGLRRRERHRRLGRLPPDRAEPLGARPLAIAYLAGACRRPAWIAAALQICACARRARDLIARLAAGTQSTRRRSAFGEAPQAARRPATGYARR